MKLHRSVIDELVVRPGQPADLANRSTSDTRAQWLRSDGGSSKRELAAQDLKSFRDELAVAQELLFASDSRALLVIFQAPDAAGKDGTIKHVMTGVNPQGCDVVSSKEPSVQELRHDFLWRCVQVLPARGRIGIFNRSYYEDVLVPKVHPPSAPSSAGRGGAALWNERYEDINNFERHLSREGTSIVKLFLHISKDEQKKRLLARLDDPAKNWKFSASDLAERRYFDEYRRAYEDAVTATSTRWAPWYVVPADHKYALRALVGGILVHVIDHLDLRLPELGEQGRKMLDSARRELLDSARRELLAE